MSSGPIGRDEELGRLVGALRRADLAGVVLTGEAGIGKTHLLDAGLYRAGTAGFAIVRITGSRALADLPLAAFAPFLPARLAGDVTDLVTLRSVLRERADGRPMVLGVDDAHLLDDASAAMVHQLAADLSVFVMGTVRTGAIPPDAVTALWKDRLVERVAIGPLDRDAIAAMAVDIAGAPLEPAAADELARRSAGNPLFARELLHTAIDTGALVLRAGTYVGDGAFPAPASINELLGSRLTGLDEQERRAVGLVAFGGALDIDVLEALVDPDALVRLETARLIVAEERGERGEHLEIRFAHPLHADAVRHATGRLVARRLQRELADALEARGGGDTDDVLRIVSLRLDSGGESSPALLARAARLAMRRHDEALAERLARSTFAATHRLSAATVLAHACMEQGRADDALTALHDPTIDLAEATPDEQVRAAVLEANVHFWGRGRAEEALAVLASVQALPTDAVRRADVDGAVATIEAFRGRPTAALALARVDGASPPSPFATMAARTALVAAGRPATAAALPDPAGVSDPTLASLLGIARAQSLVASGRIAEAAEWAIEQWEEATRARAAHRRVGWSIALADAEQAAGRLAAARRWYEDAARQAVATGANLHGRRWALGGALLCAAQTGDLPGAAELLRQLEDLDRHDATVNELSGERGRAWLLAQRDGPDAAVELLERLAEEAAEAGRHGHVVQLATDIARLDRAGRAVEILDRTGAADRIDGAYLPLMVAAVRAFARLDPVGLGEAAEGFQAIGAGLLAAEAAGGAAALADETGEDARTVAARQRRAAELRAAIDDLATPAAATAPVELALSRREREIATLVAEGRTSREVAELLVIGVRTVESHLGRVFGKLGISARSELAEALGLAATGSPR